MFTKKKIGIIGMGIMGRNLSLNFVRNGYSVSIFNRSSDKTENFVNEHSGKKLEPYYLIKDFVFSLERPRCILMIIKSGSSIDEMIRSLVPFLERGDLVIDGGNSFYKDTIRRNNELFNLGIYFIGLGISGGRLGALHGPAFMPGGQKDAYEIFETFFKGISACFEGEPCISYIGSDGSGHYVKMVHNGIEYANMQLISESYFLLKSVFNFNNQELSEIFNTWDRGELNSYLIYITKKILVAKCKDGNYLLDTILDVANNNGTGQWVSQSALDLEVPLDLITQSVFFRYLSTLKLQRVYASKILLGPLVKCSIRNQNQFIEKIRKALYLCTVISYAQGFFQLRSASNQYFWNLNYRNIAKIFRSGCIIRAKLLENIINTYNDEPLIDNLLLSPYFKNIANVYHDSLRDVVIYAVQNGIAIPSFLSAIGYYDSYRTAILPANLIQAQRDFFGAHGYKRIDSEGMFYSDWS